VSIYVLCSKSGSDLSAGVLGFVTTPVSYVPGHIVINQAYRYIYFKLVYHDYTCMYIVYNYKGLNVEKLNLN